MDALSVSEYQLMELFPYLSFADAALFLNHVASRAAPSVEPASDLASPVLPTGLPSIDEVLGGGLHAAQITELVGRAGMGKTQWCISMAARVAKAGRGVVYVDTEGKFSPERLAQVLENLGASVECARRVKVIRGDGMASAVLINLLKDLEPTIISEDVGLLVCDSVAANARLEFDRATIMERQQALVKLASTLKTLAETFQLPVLVTNQVMASQRPPLEVSRVGDELLAALGPAWAHAVNVRLVLESSKDGQRVLRLVKSPYCKQGQAGYGIGPQGVVDVEQRKAAVEELLRGLTAEDMC